MLSVRPLYEDDFDTVYFWENLPELWRVSEQTGPFHSHEIQAFMNRCLDNNQHEVERRIICFDSEPIGAIDIFDYDHRHHHCGIGIFIAEEQHRRRGHATEAIAYILDTLTNRGCRQVRAIIYNDNHSSAGLFLKVGFRQGATTQYKGKSATQYIKDL
jgi:diamine N-acetyltransferase